MSVVLSILGVVGGVLLFLLKCIGILLLVVLVLAVLLMLCPFCADVLWENETLTVKAEEARKKFCTAMDDDLNTPDALAAVFDLVKDINTLSAASSKEALEAAAKAFDEITDVLGLMYNRKKDEVPAEVTELVEKRAAAKKAKDWASADAIRAQLTEMGWAVKDTAQGPQLSKL